MRPLFVLLLTLFSCTQSGVRPATRFSLKEITSVLPSNKSVQPRALTDKEKMCVEDAFAQKYHYFGCGGQCFTFFSEDGCYVIKFFKQRPYTLSKWIGAFPVINKKKMKRKLAKRDRVFSAFELAFNQLPEETGVLYLHLHPTDHLKKEIQLIGPQEAVYRIALDEMEFVVQRRAQLAYERIDQLMSAQDVEGAKAAVAALLTLHTDLYKRGIRNRDANFRSNCGFIGNTPIIFDVGRFVQMKGKMHLEKEMDKIAPRFRSWIEGRYPQLLPSFDEAVVKILASET